MERMTLTIVSLTIANFVYQLLPFSERDWRLALQRSYFQAAAIIIYAHPWATP